MKNQTQLNRYVKLIEFLEKKFKSTIKAEDIEEVSFYSYRNINRIFLALQHETIGQFIKRRRLEKAAEYLKFSTIEISDIAMEIGYGDIAAFSKSFKKHFGCNPTQFRKSFSLQQKITNEILKNKSQHENTQELNFEVETLPTIKIVYIQYKGSYENIKEIEKTWKQLLKYAYKKKLLSEKTIVLGEVLDDNELSSSIHCRYNACIVLNDNQSLNSEGLFIVKEIPSQKYAKFIHKGSHESCFETYNDIYARWMIDVGLEFDDKPILEFYPNDDDVTPKKDLITEIYIPIL
ncbi:transcriptional regulator, AraC family [Tenacibaculum sp. MAR_2010_89]|uniref:AraC family transcriptional regulator n=1 Tax=Tenacibaculum sp. MAR_2010_89 TaxID=1250198 RepID=UPI0008966252|nr:AraC family transcriptional regulator [Tenacibaculum sp. MAR_2010_89]SED99308.1 transcriptional regulator, AraC family [Tenacibaculum sp. MAR_2010_89]